MSWLGFDRSVKLNLAILFCVGLVFWVSLSSMLPVLPLYVEDLGGSRQAVGWAMGAFSLGLLGSRSWMGYLADYRSRKLVLAIGLAVAAIAPLGYLFFPALLPICITRAFHGVSIAAFATAYTTLVVDVAPVDKRGAVIGYMSLANPIGASLGPLLGGGMQARWGYAPLFGMAASLGLMGFLLTLWVQDHRVPPDPATTVDRLGNSLRSLLSSPRIRVPALVLVLFGICLSTVVSFVPLLLRERGIALNAGLFYAVGAAASFLLRPLTGRFSDRYGRGLFITFSLLCYGLATLILWLAQTKPLFLGAALLEGAGFGVMIPMIAALMADRSLEQERGRVLGVCMGGLDLGIAIAGPLIGFIAERAGYGLAFGLATALMGIALIVFMTQIGKDVPRSLRFALGRGPDSYRISS
ncbi:MFS transporter [Trichothermofontia sichuanensis B231]|uniref:MFS transporter n=1 Tax=Trichothermofontia sichuanensis TaxID=3045816 RepID=UPI0022460279|nr:MFS transporter [Trichothermofontia sichuanensis]UZQ53169.1 MFS transporter [Trichothermofontia sichuanensis B231]